MTNKNVVLIGGMGEGLGSAVAQYFSAKNFQVIGMNRSTNNQVGKEILQLKVDLSDQGQVRHALEEMKLSHSMPDVFIHNAAELFISPLEDTSVEQFEQCWHQMQLLKHVVKNITCSVELCLMLNFQHEIFTL